MKKLFISALVAMGVIAVNAQNTLAPSKLTDNISVTIKGGATTPLQFTDDFVKDTRAVIGAEVRKQITPIFGLGAEGNWSINTDGTNTYIFDHSYVGVFGTANLSNLFFIASISLSLITLSTKVASSNLTLFSVKKQ